MSLPAHARSRGDHRLFQQLAAERDSGVLHRLPRGDHRKLGEAIQVILQAAGKMFFGIEAAHFRAVLKTQLRGIDRLQRGNSGAAGAQCAAHLRGVFS
jgi:hypothetical protein